jgi:predicted nucleotidyltransferase
LSVVTPTLDAWVLRVLVQTTRPLSGRQVSRLVRQGSLGGVQKALARLVEQGIVLADTHPSVTLFTFNRDHLGAGPVIELAQIGATLVERLRGLIQSWQVQPQHAYLFGSTARQDGDASSDVDILLVHAISRRHRVSVWAQQVEELALRVRLWTGNDAAIVDPSAADVDRMQEDDAAILGRWRRDAILLAGVQLHLRQLALG